LWPPQRGVGLQEPNLGKTNPRVTLFICLRFVLRPLLRTHLLLLTLTPACSCDYFCKFQFRPIHPPSRRLSISLIKKKVSDHPKHWQKLLSESLWAHKISKHRATKVSLFELVYGREVVLSIEISLNTVRFATQNDLTVGDYYNSMMDNIDEMTDKRVTTLGKIKKDKIMVTKD
jgi:hypothetical protein